MQLEPGSPGFSPALQPELDVFGARLVREAPLALTFEVPADHAQPFVKRLFDLLAVRDLSVERQPLELLVKEIFRSGELGPSP